MPEIKVKQLPEALPPGEYAKIILGKPEGEVNLRRKIGGGKYPTRVVKVQILDSNGRLLRTREETWVELTEAERSLTPIKLSRIRKFSPKKQIPFLHLLQ